jgi:hypothetical protein
MKISRPNPESNSVWDSTAAAGPAASNPSPIPASSTPTDRAQLSNLSSCLAAALSGSAAHVGKLTKLGAEVSSEQYQVDSYAVSGSIIEHSIQFGGSAYRALST